MEETAATAAAPVAEAVKPKSPFDAINSEFMVIEELTTAYEVGKSRKPGLRQRKAVYVEWNPDNPTLSRFLAGDIGNMTTVFKIEQAAVFTLDECYINRGSFSESWKLGVLAEEPLSRRPKQRKFDMEAVLNESLIEMARMAPGNPTLRAHFQNIFKHPVPDTVVNYDQLKDWVEFEFAAPRLRDMMFKQYGRETVGRLVPATATLPRNRRTVFAVTVTETGERRGTCRYDETVNSVGQLNVRQVDINEVLEQDDLGFDEIVERLREHLADRAVNDGIDYEPVGEERISYRDYESDDSDVSSDVNPDELRRQLTDYIRREYGTQEAEEILNS